VIRVYDFYAAPSEPETETRLAWWMAPAIDRLPTRAGRPARVLGYWWRLWWPGGSYDRRLLFRVNGSLVRDMDLGLAWPQDRMMEFDVALAPGDELTVSYVSQAGDTAEIAVSVALDEAER
jgi:hypothetical protein